MTAVRFPLAATRGGLLRPQEQCGEPGNDSRPDLQQSVSAARLGFGANRACRSRCPCWFMESSDRDRPRRRKLRSCGVPWLQIYADVVAGRS